VIFGRNLLNRLLKLREAPDVAVAAVVAHEFGHIAQFKNNLKRPLLIGQDSVKRLELHADFLAGYFAGRRKLDRPDFPAAVFATTQYAAGDYRPERVSHHGTPEERANAIVKGFEVAFRDRRSPGEALQIGVKYAQTL
jgi:predicted metalloprotease